MAFQRPIADNTLIAPQYTPSQTPPFPFLSLPPEIPLHIIQEILVRGNIIVKSRCNYSQQAQPEIERPGAKYPFTCSSFLATSRHTYYDGKPLFYMDNTFHLPNGPVEDVKD